MFAMSGIGESRRLRLRDDVPLSNIPYVQHKSAVTTYHLL